MRRLGCNSKGDLHYVVRQSMRLSTSVPNLPQQMMSLRSMLSRSMRAHLERLEGAAEAAHAGNTNAQVSISSLVARSDEVHQHRRHCRHPELAVQGHQDESLAPIPHWLLCTAHACPHQIAHVPCILNTTSLKAILRCSPSSDKSSCPKHDLTCLVQLLDTSPPAPSWKGCQMSGWRQTSHCTLQKLRAFWLAVFRVLKVGGLP